MKAARLLLVAAFALSASVSADEVVGDSVDDVGGDSVDDVGDEGFGVAGGYSWGQARDRLLVELRPGSAGQAANAIFRQDIPHTRTALILIPQDPGTAPYDVTLADALDWQRTGDELFALALENLARKFPPSVRRTPKLAQGVRVSLFYDERPYAAGHAIEMEKRKACRGRKGALVAIPNPYAMLCYPIDSKQALHGYLALVHLSADITRKGIDPLVPHVYWFHRGTWEAQRVIVGEEDLTLARTPRFDALMKALPSEKSAQRKRRW